MKSGKGPIILFLMVVGFVIYMLLGVARKPERTHAPQGGMPRKAAMIQKPDLKPLPDIVEKPISILEDELHPGQVVTIPVRSTEPEGERALVVQARLRKE